MGGRRRFFPYGNATVGPIKGLEVIFEKANEPDYLGIPLFPE